MIQQNPEMANMSQEEYIKKREEYFAKEQQVAEQVEAVETRVENGVEEVMYNGQWTKCFELPPDHTYYSPF